VRVLVVESAGGVQSSLRDWSDRIAGHPPVNRWAIGGRASGT